MRLTVIGAGPAYTDRQDASGAAYLVTHGTTNVLLDLGQGSFNRLFPHVKPETLHAVVVSHLHPDHFIDLVPLRHFLRYEFEPPRHVRALGPADLAARLDALHAEPGFTAQALDTEQLGEGLRRIGSLTLESRLVTHTNESYAVRVSVADGSGAGSGPGLVYSGDCGRADDLAPLVRPGDALLVEAAFGAGPVPSGVQHLDGPAVGRLASAASPGSLLLTHLLAGHDPEATVRSVSAFYDGPVSIVWPGERLEL
jgi:ribonuclease BN (tRNA processing enzyme)